MRIDRRNAFLTQSCGNRGRLACVFGFRGGWAHSIIHSSAFREKSPSRRTIGMTPYSAHSESDEDTLFQQVLNVRSALSHVGAAGAYVGQPPGAWWMDVV